jgi:hypothetical protein
MTSSPPPVSPAGRRETRCLATNNARADGEFADLSQLDTFADTVANVLTEFAARCDHEEDHVTDPS